MRTITDSLRTKLNTMVMTKADAPTCKVYRVYWNGSAFVEELIPQVISVNISKDAEAFNQSCDISIHNVNPSNPNDYGYYNPHRSDTAHSKPQNTWYQKLVPNARIRVYMGYGTEIKTVFYGFVDYVDIDIRPDGALLNLKCRDISKILSDRMCNSTDDGVKSWYMEYPISATTVTQHHITFAEGDTPDLADIIKDVCMRSGMISADISVQDTGITIADTADAYFEYEEVNWDSVINDIKSFTSFSFWVDEDGKARFERPLTRSIQHNDEEIMLFGVPPEAQALSKDLAVETSLVVKNWEGTVTYTRNTDYSYVESSNSIIRLAGGIIGVDEWVKVSYQYADFIFKNGKNIFQLPLTLGQEDIYGQILVKGDGVEYLHTVEADYQLWDGSTLWEDKVLIIDNEALLTEGDCQTVAEHIAQEMLEKYVSVYFKCVPIPHLQLFDLIQIIVYGTISEVYLITGINLSYNDNKMDMTIKAHHYTYASS